jgi:hypothetical protein
VLTSLEVTAPGAALQSWLKPRSDVELKRATMNLSRAVQRALKKLIPFYFFQDIDNLHQNTPAAALLVWAAITPTTAVTLTDGKLTFNTDTDVYWNFPDNTLRSVMAQNQATGANLVPALLQARTRLTEAGETGRAKFFTQEETQDFQGLAAGAAQFHSLCFMEAEIISKAVDALKNIAEFRREKKPSEAIEQLAEFGAGITSAFNERVRSIYGSASLRTLGTQILVEASRALDPAIANLKPSAMLSLTVLKENSAFPITDFLKGKMPGRDDIAVAQRLVARS